MLLLIGINMMLMRAATFPTIKNDPDVVRGFAAANKMFLMIFTIESVM